MVKRYAVIGNPIEHSLSPAMHNAAFKELGVDATYDALEVKELGKAYPILKKKYAGINVTIPHKVGILDYVDEKEMAVDLIGAANCVSFSDAARAYNTDVTGAIDALKTQVPKLKKKRVLVLGAGGAARAIVYGCVLEGAEVTLHNRTTEKAAELAKDVKSKLSKDVAIAQEIVLDGFDVLVNSTSVGMSPDSNKTPVTSPIPSNAKGRLVIMDIVYNPLETRLLKDAHSVGCKTINGMEMFVLQGAESLRVWGYDPPVEVMRETVLKELRKK